MGTGEIEDATEALLKLEKVVDTEKMNKPSF